MAMDLSQCGDIMGVPNAAGTDCECALDHHWVANAGMPHGGTCVPNPPNANPLDYSRVIPAAESFEDPICVEGFTLVNGVCEQDASDNGMVIAEEDPPDSDSSMPICPVNYFYDDTYEWSDETGARIGACVPDPAVFECGPGLHYQPSGEKGTDSLLAGGTCVEDYSPPVQSEETEADADDALNSATNPSDAVQEALDAAGPVFTPVVGCCTTEIGNAIVTGLLENYRSELETIY